jgi:hypothetical protein
MIDYLPLVLTGIGIMASILYYANVLRNASKTRELQIFMTLLSSLNSQEQQTAWAELLNAEFTDYDDYMSKYDSATNPEYFGKRASVWANYNLIGYLLKRGHVSIDLVYDYLGLPAVLHWNKWGDMILEVRRRQEISQYFKGFEYLVSELQKYQQKHPELAT